MRTLEKKGKNKDIDSVLYYHSSDDEKTVKKLQQNALVKAVLKAVRWKNLVIVPSR